MMNVVARRGLLPRWGLALLLAGSLTPLQAAASVPLSDEALALARTLQAAQMGVDRAGNLWTRDSQSGAIRLYSPKGAELARSRVSGALSVDVDHEWGVAAVVSHGFELRLMPPGDKPEVSIQLGERADGVAWIDPQTVAVSQALAAHRVEIWNTQQRKILRKLGTETALQPEPGVTILRTVGLEYDPRRNLLYTLGSYKGDLQVFSLDGQTVRQEQLPLPDRTELETFFAEQGRQKKARNEIFTPSIRWFRQAVDDNGTVWSVQQCDPQRGKAVFLKVPLQGKMEVIETEERCCSKSLVLWGGWLLLYSDPASPRASCSSVRRLP